VFHKIVGHSRVAAQLAASQEDLSSMKSVRYMIFLKLPSIRQIRLAPDFSAEPFFKTYFPLLLSHNKLLSFSVYPEYSVASD
jgi:hypothetical protein